MLENLISISTLMICTFLSTAVVGLFMSQIWLRDRRQTMAAYWSLSMWIGTLAALLLALRGVAEPLLAVGLGNMLVCLSYAFMWAGFRAFDGRQVPLSVLGGGAFVWAAAYLLVPVVTADVNARIILMSLIVAAYCVCIAVEVFRGYRVDPLPTRRIVAFLFATHGVVYSLRVPMAIADPAELNHGTGFSPWFAAFTLELFVHTILSAVAMLALMKERSEFTYRRAARIDALTGILNRGTFLSEMGSALARNPRSGTLMILDLDHFKTINDTFGHIAGDRVLRQFCTRIGELLDKGTLFGRLGGEEFAIFAPAMEIGEAARCAERLRSAVADMSVDHEGNAVGVTTSVGLACVALNGGVLDNLMATADIALYRAKAEGRNRVAVAGPADCLLQIAGRMRGVEESADAVA